MLNDESDFVIGQTAKFDRFENVSVNKLLAMYSERSYSPKNW